MPWQVPITIDGLEYPVTFNTEAEPTQDDLNEAVQSILQQRNQAVPQPTGETPGYLSQLGTALDIGYRQMASGVGATFNALTGDTADVASEMVEQAKLQREQQAAQTPEDVQFMQSLGEAEKAYEEASGPFETIGALAQYPAAVMSQPGAAFKTAVQSAPNVLVSGATQLAGRAIGGVLGGVAGIETGPGAILTGLAGYVAGGALSNTLMEAGPAIYDVLYERTQGAASNMTADQIAAYLKENPDVIDEGLKTGAVRGTVIGAVESIGMKGAGRLLTMPERAAARAVQKKLVDAGVDIASKAAVDKALLDPALRTAARTAADAAKSQFSSAGNLARLAGASAIETGASGAGELAAQAAAGQEVSTKEAFLEMLGEVALSAPMAAATKTIEGAKYILNPALQNPDTQESAKAANVVIDASASQMAADIEANRPSLVQAELDRIEKDRAERQAQDEASFQAIRKLREAQALQQLGIPAEQPATAPTPITPATEPIAELPPPSPLTGQPTALPVGTATPTTTPEDAAPEIPLEESLRQEPQDRVEIRTPEETGVGDSLLRPARGEEEEVDRGVALPPPPEGVDSDIIDYILGNWSIESVGKKQRDKRRTTGEVEAFERLSQGLLFPARNILFSPDRGRNLNRGNLDVIAQAAFERNLIPSPDANALTDEILKAYNARKSGKSPFTERRQQEEAAEQRTLEFEKAARERTAPLTLMPARDLEIGDVVQVGDDNMRVTFEYDEDGYPTVTILTGPKFGEQRVDPYKPFKAEKLDETNRVQATSEFVSEAELEGAIPEPPPAEVSPEAPLSRSKPREAIVFKKPIKTPLGEVLRYSWSSQLVEDVDRLGEPILRRISDWEQAATNAETGRDIVHRFQIRKPDGTITEVSLESTMGALSGDMKKTFRAVISAARRLPFMRAELAELEAKKAASENEYQNLQQQKPSIDSLTLEAPVSPAQVEAGKKQILLDGVFVGIANKNDLNEAGELKNPQKVLNENVWQWRDAKQKTKLSASEAERMDSLRRRIKKAESLIKSQDVESAPVEIAAPTEAPAAQPPAAEQTRAKINLGSLLGAINAMPEDSESRVVPGAETPVTDAKSGYLPNPNWTRKPGFKARAQALFNKYFPQVAIVEAAPGQSFGGSVVMGFTPTDGFGYRIFLHELGHALSDLNPDLFKTRAVRAELDAISQDDFYIKNVLIGRGNKYTLSPGEVIAEFNAARFAFPELNERFPELAAALNAAVSKTPSLNKLSSREAELLSAKVAKAQETGLERLGKSTGGGSAYARQWRRIVDASQSTDEDFIRQVMDEAKQPFVDPDTGELTPWSRAYFGGYSVARQIAEGSIDANLVAQLNKSAPAATEVAPVVTTPEAEAQQKKDEKEAKKLENESRASLARLVAGERGNPVFGNVTMDDGIEALRQLDEAGDLPNIFFTEITTTQEFLSKPENEQNFPDTWAALSAGGKAEGMEEKGTAFVFIDNVGVTNLDRKLATQFGTTPEVAAVRRVAVHESIHKAISFLNESEQIALFRYMRELYSPEQLDVLAETYTNFANWRESKSSYLNLIEESLTRTIDSMESLPKDGILGEFIQWLKRIWRKITGKKGEPTLNDLKDVMRLIRNGLRNSTKARADRTISGGVVRYSAVAPQATATDAEYLAAVEAGDSGNDNLNQLLRDASPDERQAVVDSWIKRNPRAAARMQRIVKEAAKAAGYDIEAYHGASSKFNVFDAEKILNQDAGIGFYFTKDEDLAKSYASRFPKGKVFHVFLKQSTPLRTDVEYPETPANSLAAFNNTVETITKDGQLSSFERQALKESLSEGGAAPNLLSNPSYFQSRLRAFLDSKEFQNFNSRSKAYLQTIYDVLAGRMGRQVALDTTWALTRMDGLQFEKSGVFTVLRPNQIKSASPVTFDNAGNIIPPPQRFQPTSPDIRFSLPTLVSESASAFSSGQQAARAISFTPRQLDVYMAVLGAFSTLRRKGKQSATMQELFDAANTLVSGITPNEFSETLQGLYNDNAALLNPGDSTFQVFNRDGELAGAVVLVAKDTSRASLIPPEEVKGITDKLTSDMDKAVTEGEQSPFEGLSFTGNVPKMHARVNFRNVEKAAEDFVNQMIRSRKEKGRTYIEALIDIADMVATDNFAKEYIGGAGMESQGLVLQAIPPPLNNKIYAAQMTNISEADRVRLEDAYRKVSLYYEGIGTVGGTLQGYRAWTATRGKYGWLLDSWKADALKTAEYAVNAQMGGSVSVKINQDLNDAVTGVGKAVADEVSGIVEEDAEMELLREGEAELNKEEKGLWSRAKMLLRRLAMYARRKTIKAASAARASLSKAEIDELNAILLMSDEEAEKAEAKDRAELKSVLKQLLGEDKPTDTPAEKAKKGKRKRMVKVVEQIIFREGKDVEFRKTSIQEAVADLFNGADEYGKIVEEVGNALLARTKQAKGMTRGPTAIRQLVQSIKQTLLANLPPPKAPPSTNATLGKMLAMTFSQQIREARLYADAWSKGRTEVRSLLAETGLEGEALENELDAIMPPTPTLAYAPNAAKRAIALAMEQAGVTREELTDGRVNVSNEAKAKVMAAFDAAAAAANLSAEGWSTQGATGRQLAERALNEAVQQWIIQASNRVKISSIVAEQADNPVSIEEFAKKLSQFNLTPKQVKRYFDIAARAAVRRVEINNEKAKRIIYERGDIRPDVAEKDVDGDTVIEAFRDQVNSPTEEQAFLERLSKLRVAENVAKDLFNTAARERRDRQRTRVFDMIEGKNAIQKMLREIALARRGIEMPLRNPIPWTELLSKPAKSVDEYRQRVLDGILANPDMESVDNDVKERIADMFTDLWQEQVDKAVNRVIDNYTLQLDRAQRRQAGEALNKSRSKVIQHLNLGVLSNDAFIRILGEKFGIKMDMTKEERKHIESLLATLQDESLPKNKRNQASDDLASALMQYTKVGWSARLSLFWAMSVLAGWNTMLAIGMSFMNGANIILVRTPIGILSKMVQGDFKGALDVTFDSLNDMKRYLEAFPEAVDRAWGYITSGKVDLLEAEAAAPDRLFKSWDSLAKYRKVADQMVQDPKMLVRWMGTFMRMIGRIMTALDGFNTIVTKRGHLSMAVRLVAPDKEAFDRIIAKGSIEHYRQMLLASDPYFANMTPEKRRLLNSTAEAMMYQAMNEEGAKLENADFYASESAFTMDPSGLGGMIYGAIKKAEETSKSFAERNLAEKRLEAQGADRLSLENAKLATAYITHFLAYNAVNYVGLRFARFAANKFNQGLSFIPFLGMTRFWEKSNSKLVDRQEAFTEMIYRNQAVGAVFAILGVMLIRALDEEPDDEKRGWFINGGLENVPTAQRRQLQEGGKLQYRLGVKINGRWLVFSYQNWPWSQLFSALGSTSDMIRFSPEKWREKGTSDILLSVAASGLTSTLDLPALQGLGTVLGRSISSSDPAEDFWTNIGAASANWVGGFIPKPLMDLDYILDSNRRKYTTIWEKTAGVVPFYRRYVGEDYYNILGDPIKRNALPGSREFLLGPTEPAYKILGALNSRDIWLTPANAEQRMVGKGRNRRRLTQQEADAYSLETGKAYKTMILRYGPRALKMSPERARAFLSDKADEVRDRVLMKVYRGYRSRPSAP